MRARIMTLGPGYPPSRNKLFGTVELRNGKAEPSNEKVGLLLSTMPIIDPGNLKRILTFEDGAEYVKALPANIRGQQTWAEVEP